MVKRGGRGEASIAVGATVALSGPRVGFDFKGRREHRRQPDLADHRGVSQRLRDQNTT